MQNGGLDYDFIGAFTDGGLAIAYKDGKRGLINARGEEILPCKYDDLAKCGQIFILKNSGKYGIFSNFSEAGATIATCEFDELLNDDANGAAEEFCAKKGGKWGVVDKNGAAITPFKFDEISEVAPDFIVAKKDEKWGIANKRAQTLTAFEYDGASRVRCGKNLFKVCKDGKYALVGINGEVKLPQGYYIDYFWEGFAAVQEGGSRRPEKGGKWGYVNSLGELAILCEYDEAEWFHDGLAKVGKDGREFFIDQKGKIAFYCEFDETQDFGSGLAAARDGKKWGFLDKNGKIAIHFLYDEVGDAWFLGKFCRARIGEKWGVIDKNGVLVIPFKFDAVDCPNENGYAVVQNGGKYGFADKNGEIVPCEYDFLQDDKDALIAQKGEKYGLISTSGKTLTPLAYDDIENFSGGLALAENDGKIGFLDAGGGIAVAFEYDGASEFNGGFAPVQKDGRWFVIDKNGEILAPKAF